MTMYATFLNLDNANEHCLDHEDLYVPELQEQITHRMICGTGSTKEEAMQDALRRLIDKNVIETFECSSAACGILKLRSGKDALRHMWFYDDGNEYSPQLHSLPYHRVLVEFCDRYNLPDEAEEYLLSLFAEAS